MIAQRGFTFWICVLILAVVSALMVTVGWVMRGPARERTAQAQDQCTEVLTIGPETENIISEPFEITGNTFRLSGDLTFLTEGGLPGISITPMDEQGNSVGFFPIDQEGPFTENVLEGPGTFTLEITTINQVEYTITVEDCGSSPTGGGAAQYDDSSVAPPAEAPVAPPADDPSLFESGGPEEGPAPVMPGGACPPEFPNARDGGCWR